MTRRVLLVDGYNVVRSTPPYQHLADLDLAAARDALIADVAAFATGEWDATVVFDGGNNPESRGIPSCIAGITVVYSPFQASADTVIESLARKARDAGAPVEVVTSDAQTQWAVMGGQVIRRSSAEFAGELRVTEEEWRQASGKRGVVARIEERIPAPVREALETMLRRRGPRG